MALRAAVRVQVKRPLPKYGYPPDLQDAAVQQVVKQAELIASELAREARAVPCLGNPAISGVWDRSSAGTARRYQ